MVDKYPSTSPYAYCRNNPIILVDPNGEFDTRSEARQYRKEHHTGGKIVTRSAADNFSGNYSIINKKTRRSYTKPDYDYTQPDMKFIGLDKEGVVSSPLARDPRSRRERFEDFEMKATQKGGAVGQGLATAIPIGSEVNDITTLIKGKNMFGDKASVVDKVWAIIGLTTLSVGHLVRRIGAASVSACKKVDDFIEGIECSLNVRSGVSTAKKKMENEKNK